MELAEKHREKEIYAVTIIGSGVNFFLIVFKFIAGILGRSSAMIADAVHSLSDFIIDIILLIFVKISNKPSDKTHNYGHGKFETLATFLIGVILMFVGLGIAWNGINAIIYVVKGGTLESPGFIALFGAILSIIFKEVLYWYTLIQGRKLNSQVVIANAWHHRSDAFSSIATAIGIGGAIFLGEKWTILDPLAGILVSFFIIKTAFKIMKPCLDELLEKSLPDEVKKEIEKIVYSFEDVSNLHDLCTRKIGNYCAIDFHVKMDGNTTLNESQEIIIKIENKLKERYGNRTHVIIHMEPL